jgi:DNA repair photolyase
MGKSDRKESEARENKRMNRRTKMVTATRNDRFTKEKVWDSFNSTPLRVKSFELEQIILAKGSMDTPARRRFVERVCTLYRGALVIEQLDVPHNRVQIASSKGRFELGRRTLVFGVIKDGVRASREGKTCPSHWSFSVYGFCPYRCVYCYLPGSSTFWHSPSVRIYLNIEQILSQIDTVANRQGQVTPFVLGRLQDGLALDPLTGYSALLVPFFAEHKFARQILLTKSVSVERLLELEHRGHTIISWSLNPPEIAKLYELGAPSYEERVKAMERCASRGYPVRATVMPFIPYPGWKSLYADMLHDLLRRVQIERLTLGGLCIAPRALGFVREKLADARLAVNELGTTLYDSGRVWYDKSLCASMYTALAEVAHYVRPNLPIDSCHTL